MKLVLDIREGGDDRIVHRFIDKFPIFIGRGYQNDIILSDPYVSAKHLRIDYNGHDYTISDLDSENGASINGEPVMGPTVLRSGDMIRLGHVELRAFTPHHAVPPALPLALPHPTFNWLSRPGIAWICFGLALIVTQAWTYLEIWTEETRMALTAAAGAVAATILFWAAAWSIGGRLIGNRSNFRGHSGLMALYMTASAFIWYIEAYVDFLMNENRVAVAITYIINFGTLALLLYGSFTLATRMARRQRIIFAVIFSISVATGAFILNFVSAKNFNQQPVYAARLEPFLSGFARTDNLKQFMAGNSRLFDKSEELTKNPPKQE